MMRKTLLGLMLLASTAYAEPRIHLNGGADILLLNEGKKITLNASEPMNYEYITSTYNNIDTMSGREYTIDVYMDERCKKNKQCSYPLLMLGLFTDAKGGGYVIYYDLLKKAAHSTIEFKKSDVTYK
ncbi:hypothetical protein IBT47_05640 [Erwinia sp. S43]|uniref:hypothetical protein n=1 Tax=Erwinia sp. S43 TaxID=2769339 RepID=UPI00190C3348|nr:hypothetical protein [Erwinia sp. S43]MBK0031764.1 hypothetical protein [Erwinia sp. S43]